MRAPLFGAVILAAAVIAEAFAASPAPNSASNSAHVCGDKRLSSADQMDCRAQMDAAKTEGERLRVQGNFEKLSASVAGEASTNARRNPPTKTGSPPPRNNGPQTNPSTTPAESYPPAEATPPVYPGDVPNPKTGKPPT